MHKKIKIILLSILMLVPFYSLLAIEVARPTKEEEKILKVWILEESGVKMYSDSLETEEKELGVTIPSGTVVNGKALREKDEYFWLFVEYNKTEGWIVLIKNFASRKVALQNLDGQKEVAGNVTLYENPVDGSAVVGEIPSGTIVNPKYGYGGWNTWFYIEEGNYKGWVKGVSSFVRSQETSIVLLNDTYVYSSPGGEKQDTKVSKNEIITLTGISEILNSDNKSEIYGKTLIGNIEKWILISGDKVNYAEKLDNGNLDNEVAMITKGDKIYSTADSSASVVGTIAEDTKITEAYKYKDTKGNDSYYIISNSGKGWVLKEFYDYKEEEEKTDVPKVDDNKNDKKGSKVSLYIIIFGIIVVLAVIGLFIFNSNKNKRQ